MVIMSDSIASNSSDSGDEIIDESENFEGNAGWANSISKILKSGKPKKKKTLVLSRAKKIGDKKAVESKPINFEIDGVADENDDEKSEPAAEVEETQTTVVKKRKQLPKLRVKPNILERDRERMLSKIATKGVVQLFNAVKMQQKNIETQLKEAGPLEVKRDKVLKSIDKDSFFDLLDKDVENRKSMEKGGTADKTRQEGTWDVLKDDFMLKAKYKDWDKQTQDEEEEEEMEIEEELESD